MILLPNNLMMISLLDDDSLSIPSKVFNITRDHGSSDCTPEAVKGLYISAMCRNLLSPSFLAFRKYSHNIFVYFSHCLTMTL